MPRRKGLLKTLHSAFILEYTDCQLRLGLLRWLICLLPSSGKGLDGQALARALEVAEQIAANGPLAVQAILRTIRETERLAESEAFAIESRIGMNVFMSADAKEGPRAFAEKRAPVFTGR